MAVTLLGCFICIVQAGKVLISTTPVAMSHMMNLKKIAIEVEQRGNSVMVSLLSLVQLSRFAVIIARSGSFMSMIEMLHVATSHGLGAYTVSAVCSG